MMIGIVKSVRTGLLAAATTLCLAPGCGDSATTSASAGESASESESSASEGTQTSAPTSSATESSGTNPSSSGTQGGSTSTQGPTTDPDTTTGKPGTTTDKPGTTTDKPDTTTGKPGTTTGKPGTTDKPGTTGDGLCSPEGKGCAMGEECCEGLSCCAGVPVPPGEEFCSNNCPISDRNLKRDFLPVDTDDVLERVAALPITTWSYKKDDPRVRHIGPMAQDFQGTFGVGASDRFIFQIDADGVSLAATQALYRRVKELDEENQALRASVEAMEARLAALEAR